jgi:hypothetical protein
VYIPARRETIDAELRYISAKLRQLELDQMIDDFPTTAKKQGIERAITGAFQRTTLRAIGLVSDKYGLEGYLAREQAKIDEERVAVKEFEQRTGATLASHAFAANIRDSVMTDTYADTRRAFDAVIHDLRKEQIAGMGHGLRHGVAAFGETVRHARQGILATALGLAIGLGVTIPTHQHNERKDHARPVVYQETHDAHPAVELAVAAHNLEMYLHDGWNKSTPAKDLVWEWDAFVKPGARTASFDSAGDRIRPWAQLYAEAVKEYSATLHTTDKSVQLIGAGDDQLNRAWVHRSHDTYHTQVYVTIESYPCGTTKSPRTCTRPVTKTRQVYDYTDHTWTLDHAQLSQALQRIAAGQEAAPLLDRASIPPSFKHTMIGQLVRGKTKEEAEALANAAAQWRGSAAIQAYETLRSRLAQAKGNGLVAHQFANNPSYPAVFTNRSYHHSPTALPAGWKEHQSLVSSMAEVGKAYNGMTETLQRLDGMDDKVIAQMQLLRDEAQAEDARYELADLAWELHGAHLSEGKRFSRAGRLTMEWLLFLGLTGLGTFGVYKGIDAFKEERHKNRMGHY